MYSYKGDYIWKVKPSVYPCLNLICKACRVNKWVPSWIFSAYVHNILCAWWSQPFLIYFLHAYLTPYFNIAAQHTPDLAWYYHLVRSFMEGTVLKHTSQSLPKTTQTYICSAGSDFNIQAKKFLYIINYRSQFLYTVPWYCHPYSLTITITTYTMPLY